jgi:DNA-directed RNA polymerase subunit RPC12/RpoP
MSEEAKCDCQHCGGHIAFASEQTGQNVVCPHCGKETLMDIPPQPSLNFFVWQNEQGQGPFDQETIQRMISEGQINSDTLLSLEDGSLGWTPAKELFLQDSTPENVGAMTTAVVEKESSVSQAEEYDDGCRLEIRLGSGAELKIKAVRLYDEINLAEISSLRATAVKSLRGVSTGLGSFGSIGWVLATSVVIGAVEGVLSAGAASSGSSMLSEVIRLEEKLRTRGVMCPVGRIENIETPIPGLWRVCYKRQARIGTGKTFLTGEQKFELREVQSALIHPGDDFLTVQTGDGSVRSIRWSAVESYACQKPNKPA